MAQQVKLTLFASNSDWNLALLLITVTLGNSKVKKLLTLSDNIRVVRPKQFHKKTIDDKV